MPRYLVERTYHDGEGAGLPGPADPLGIHREFSERNGEAGVVWIHSFVTADNKKSFCLYEGPSPEAVRRAANLNSLPVDRINEVRLHGPSPAALLEDARSGSGSGASPEDEM